MSSLLQRLDAGASGRGKLRIIGNEGGDETFNAIWKRAEGATGSLRAAQGDEAAIAMFLSASFPCIVSFLAALRAGVTVVSVPLPGRGIDPGTYAAQVISMCKIAGARTLLVEERYEALLPALPVDVVPYERLLAAAAAPGAPLPVDGQAGTFVQFTSGSSSTPKGVRITHEALAANIDGVLARLQVEQGDSACSWLPLSHDMGLIGMFLTAWCGAGPDHSGTGDIVLMRPETFLGRPALWMEACEEHRATFTAGPDFGYALATRATAGRAPRDLRSLRVCITGAERIRTDTLRRFAEAHRPAGFDDRAFCPAYGLAEMALAVTLTPASSAWHSERLDPVDLHAGRRTPQSDESAVELVATGPALPGVDVRIDARSSEDGIDVGEIVVRGPSMCTEYLGASLPITSDGWLRTGDLGYLDGDDLYVVGRHDDIIVVGGRNYSAVDMERWTETLDEIRPGASVAIPSDDNGFAVVAETKATAGVPLEALARDVRRILTTYVGVAPRQVVFVPPGTLPKTPSGKPRRFLVRHGLLDGSLAIQEHFEYAGRR